MSPDDCTQESLTIAHADTMSLFGRLLNKSKAAAVPDALPKPTPGVKRKRGNPETPFVVYGLGNKTHPNTKHSVRGQLSIICPDVA